MLELTRTDSSDSRFIELVRQLDADLAHRDGSDHAFYSQFNKITLIKHAVVAVQNGIAVGCGAIKQFDEQSMEVKRMFTLPEMRGKGVAGAILSELEKWAKELSYKKCVLETGKRQPEAIALYQGKGFKIVPNYGQYVGMDNSVCFEKIL